MSTNHYPAPKHSARAEIEVKRSRFLALASPVRSREQALEILDECRKRYPDATHHCWAMVAGAPDDVHQQDQSDDGEPRGTAGRPMLDILRHAGIGHIMVVVVRWFGGTRLGTGGLARAYSLATRTVMETLEWRTIHRQERWELTLDYATHDTLERAMSDMHSRINNRDFSDVVRLQIAVALDEREALAELLERHGVLSLERPG